MIDTLRQDLVHAARSLSRRPLVSAVATLSLALGVGVNTAMFSILDRVLLAALPVPSPEELVALSSPGPRPGNSSSNDTGDARAPCRPGAPRPSIRWPHCAKTDPVDVGAGFSRP